MINTITVEVHMLRDIGNRRLFDNTSNATFKLKYILNNII